MQHRKTHEASAVCMGCRKYAHAHIPWPFGILGSVVVYDVASMPMLTFHGQDISSADISQAVGTAIVPSLLL